MFNKISNIKNSFSIIELIFVIIIISILSTFIIPSFIGNKNEANFVKLKSTVLAIQNAIVINHSKNILENRYDREIILDTAPNKTAGELLFIGTQELKLLDSPIISTDHNSPENGTWSKESADTYYYWIDKNKNIIFKYSNEKFVCDYKNNDCLKIYE
jgi:type II secretory pathway pseudopilin PulG